MSEILHEIDFPQELLLAVYKITSAGDEAIVKIERGRYVVVRNQRKLCYVEPPEKK